MERRVAVFLCLLGLLCGSAPHAEAVILINEILADPPALLGDANRDGMVSSTQDEFVELVNTAVDPVSLAGWTLSDDLKVRHVFALDAQLSGGGFFVIFGGGTPQGFAQAVAASTGGLSLNNSGDIVKLKDGSAVLIDSFVYGPEGGMDVSLTRSPDAVGPFVKHSTVNGIRFSPGTTVDGRFTLFPPIAPQPSTPPVVHEPLDPPPDAPNSPVVPEPSAFVLFGSALAGCVGTRQLRTL